MQARISMLNCQAVVSPISAKLVPLRVGHTFCLTFLKSRTLRCGHLKITYNLCAQGPSVPVLPAQGGGRAALGRA